MKKGNRARALVVLLVIAAILGIWAFKSYSGSSSQADYSSGSASESESSLVKGDYPQGLTGEDFRLRETTLINYEALSSHGLPIVVDYGADSCIPCKEMAPVLEKANSEFMGRAFIKFVNVWDHPEAASNVPVQVIPTQVIFSADGKPFAPSEALAARIRFDKYVSKDTGEHVFTVHQGGLTEDQLWAILEELGAAS